MATHKETLEPYQGCSRSRKLIKLLVYVFTMLGVVPVTWRMCMR